MAIPESYSFTRYLEAKKSIDDRSLNGHVWRALAKSLPAPEGRPLRVLEAGAGVGTMIERLLDRGLLDHAAYTAIDVDKESLACARRRIGEWSAAHGLRPSAGPGPRLALAGKGKRIGVDFRNEDFFSFAARATEKWDLVVASAFLDLVDLRAALPRMLKLLGNGGVFYFPINFDGATAMEPADELDDLVFGLYHRSMDERRIGGERSGGSRAGRSLFPILAACGARILAAGGSDWVVFSGPDGYPGDEAYFLHHIVHLVHEALKGSGELGHGRLGRWVAERRRQIEDGRLVYIAHQLDLVGTV